MLGYLNNTHKNPKFGRVEQVPTREQIYSYYRYYSYYCYYLYSYCRYYSTNSSGQWLGTFWAVLHQVLPGIL